MANSEHLAKLKEGVETWNRWRAFNYKGNPDLSGEDLREANLTRANLDGANLRRANLHQTHLNSASLYGADLGDVNCCKADFTAANLRFANLRNARLTSANLYDAVLCDADLSGANLTNADLRGALLLKTNMESATLTGCRVYGISAWDVKLKGAVQSNLLITRDEQSTLQVDDLEVAQFICLLLNNPRIREVIDTITSKVVLILGRFTPERKVVLDAIRDELRKRDYVAVLFDFEKPASKDLTGTISTLANMARFIIADLTDPSSVPHELATLAPNVAVPVQTVLLEGQHEYAMFHDVAVRGRSSSVFLRRERDSNLCR